MNFQVTTTGQPAPALSETGGLPSGVSFVDNGDGTATISGNIPTGAVGSYPITITADNGVDTPAQQSFTIVVQPGLQTSSASLSFNEGNSPAGVVVNVPVTLTEASSSPITVHYQTNDGPGPNPASNGVDYQATSGTLTIPANHTSANIGVRIYGDTIVEPDETFTVSISSPTNAVLGAQTSTIVTIANDDHATLKIVGTNVNKPSSGIVAAPVTVSLTNPVSVPVTVSWSTADGTAKIAAKDYVAASGTLTFAPGQTSQQVSVNVRGNQRLEDTRYYKLLLSGGSSSITGGLSNTSASTTAQIINTVWPTMQLNNQRVYEGNYAVIKTRLLERYYQPITLCYITSDGTATAASGRYTPLWNCNLTVPAGSNAAPPISIQTFQDDTPEPNTDFFLTVYDPSGHIPSKTATITIRVNNT